jgi:glucose/arabinose dehydrogenase
MSPGPWWVFPVASAAFILSVASPPCVSPAAAQPGLKAAYGFNEGSGPTAFDVSGFDNRGTITGATWTSQGYYGSALAFDGGTAMVTVPNSPSLQLTSAMTLEAWVYPTLVASQWTDIIEKGNDDYYLMATTEFGGVPAVGSRFAATLFGPSTLPANTWTHVAATYDGSSLRLYANGVQVSSRAQTGTIPTSSDPLSFGGDPLFGQYFSGRLDEIRIYDRALSPSEIQADMATPITSGDTTPPTVSIVPPGSSTVGGVEQVEMTASDNVLVTSVSLFIDGVNIGTTSTSPYFINWNTTTSGNGVHQLTAQASDAAGNVGTSPPVSVTVQNPFFTNEVIVPGISAATTIVFLPDDRMLVGELTEKIWVVHPGSTTPETKPFLTLDGSNLVGEQGLMDITLDPGFVTNHWYYIYYTRGFPSGDNYNRVSRFTASGDSTVPGSEVVLWQDDTPEYVEHHGGAIFFGPGGKLFFTTGDEFSSSDAQSLRSYRGKVLRINADGSIPTDNPFYDGNGPNKDEIWAYGLRNPFRASYDAVSGRIFIGDVGGNDWNTAREEVNIGAAGANYGWPLCEGSCGTSGLTDPLYAYPHLGRDASITGGFVMRGGSFPSEYEGNYFFADYAQNWIKRLTFDASGNLLGVVDFEPPDGTADGPYGDPVKLLQGPDGSLYYVDIGFNADHDPNEAGIRRIRPVMNDQPPVAVASANPLSGQAPLTVDFSSAGSFDPEGGPLSYNWTFGDGASSTTPNPSHTYAANGEYTARVQVSDGVNFTLSNSLVITVGTPPTVAIVSPTDGSLFVAGEVIQYSGTGLDGDGNPLPASAFSWTIVFHHDEHVHPGGTISGVTGGSFTIPSSGHDFSGATSYEFILTVTDTNGLSASKSVTIFPDKVNLTFSTIPSGLSLDLDGIRRLAPFVVDAVKGFQYTINAPAQTVNGVPYTFVSWSDGGGPTHQIVVPTFDASWTATFSTGGTAGLKAAYAFTEGAGPTTADGSGSNNVATLAGATWTPDGYYGSALSFNGFGSMVTVPNSASLQLTTAMTLEAWVYPTLVASQWTDIIEKGNDDYYLMATTEYGGTPGVGSRTMPALLGPSTLPVNTWTHLAATYDGSSLRLYVNGLEVSNRTQTGAIPTSSDPLSFGGDPLFGQYFSGRIDEIRVYDRALSAPEIQIDMTKPIPTAVEEPGITRPPSASALVNAAPNPFTPSTRIHFRLASSGGAKLRVFSVTGRLVHTFPIQDLPWGDHSVVWNGTDDAGRRVGSGVYVARLDAADGADRLRILLVR